MLSPNNLGSFSIQPSGVATGHPAAWLRVSGGDAADFLQGQCTQELRGLAIGQTVLALWLTLKGKVMGESLVVKAEGEVWWLWSACTGGAALRARLEDFIIADDVVVEVPVGWKQVTLAGEAAAGWLREAREGREPPGAGRAEQWGGGWLFAGRRGQAAVWDWVYRQGEGADSLDVPGGPSVDVLGHLAVADLRRARLAAGVPAIPEEFGPGDLPQEAGLEEVAISFTKGCYLGQEVMARLHAMGQVRRRLVRVTGLGPPPAAGVELRQKGKRVGELRAVAELESEPMDGAPRPAWLGLAMVNLLGLDLAVEIRVAEGLAVTLIDSV